MSGPVGIIAGEGRLPFDVADSVLAQGRDVFVVRISGIADEGLAAYSGAELNMGMVGAGIALLREQNCTDIVFVGYLTRPDLARVQFDEVGTGLLPDILAAAPKGDDAIMGVFIAAFEAAGFNVLGAEETYTNLLCPEGVLTDTCPTEADQKDLARAFDVAGMIGREDIGQACVVCAGLVLALEAQEGTDGLLQRVGALDPSLRGTTTDRRGVLVKRAKPGQERRVDLPTIGPQTISYAAAAGLAGIGLEAKGSLIVDRVACVAAANEAGLFIVGLAPDEPGK